MSGYSGTPLTRKLGIKSGHRVALLNAPEGYRASLDIPADCDVVNSLQSTDLDVVQYFTKDAAELERVFGELVGAIKSNGAIWISWPKMAARVATDLNENVVREIGLRAGLVDVKVCAVDDVWSGLKLVRRLADRG